MRRTFKRLIQNRSNSRRQCWFCWKPMHSAISAKMGPGLAQTSRLTRHKWGRHKTGGKTFWEPAAFLKTNLGGGNFRPFLADHPPEEWSRGQKPVQHSEKTSQGHPTNRQTCNAAKQNKPQETVPQPPHADAPAGPTCSGSSACRAPAGRRRCWAAA